MCDFIEDENGFEIFLKVRSCETSGPKTHHANWLTSSAFKPAAQINFIPPKCEINLMCNFSKFGEQIFQIATDFETVCRELEIWKF